MQEKVLNTIISMSSYAAQRSSLGWAGFTFDLIQNVNTDSRIAFYRLQFIVLFVTTSWSATQE